MKKRRLLMLFYMVGAGYLFMFAGSPLSPVLQGVVAAPAFAQGHSGHSAQPAAQTPAKEKPEAVKQPPGKQEAPPEQAAQEPPQVEISPEQQRLIGVKTVKVTQKPLQKVIRTVGRVEADERKLATVNTKVEGWIEKLYVNYTGRYVKKGEPLAEIYSPELLATQQEFIGTLKWAGRQPGAAHPESAIHGEHAQKPSATGPEPVSELKQMIARDAAASVEASRQRLRLWDISSEQIRKLEETGNPVRTLTLYSPVSGFITQKMAVQGMKVMPGEKLFDVADLSTLWMIADIYEYELSLIRVGQPARITLAYFPGKTFASQIDYIYPTISPDTRTARVRLALPNPDGNLKPQMFTNVEIRISLGRRLTIPESAVIDTGKEQVVYVDRGGGAFEPREVQLGLRADGDAEVLRGLKAGETVASSANFLIDSEAQLKGVKPLKRNNR
jgi:Cu(I)/Ag(I) efflux system membrane fusion protein